MVNTHTQPPLGGRGAKIGKITANPEAIESLVHYVKLHPNDTKVKAALAKIAKQDPVSVMTSIVRQSHSLYKKEITHFLTARSQALNVYSPNRFLLMELYKDLEIDPFIYGLVYNKRILKVSNKRIKVVSKKTKETDDDKTLLLQKKWFNDFTKYALQSKFFGYSLTYFSTINTDATIAETKLVYREHVLPNTSQILKNVFDLQGIDYTKPPFSNYMIGIGDAEDLGLYEKAALLYILKKHSWANWDEFEEIFGIPIRIAKTASQDDKVKGEIVKWLSSMGSAAYGLFPQDAELDIKENNKTDSFQVFNEKRKACNEELEILITGQNRVTQNGGSYAKEKAMETETDELTKDDMMFMYYIYNDKLLPLLTGLGYAFTDDDEIVFDDEKQELPKDRMELFKTVNDMGFKLDGKQIEKEFGITITGEKDSAKLEQNGKTNPSPLERGKGRGKQPAPKNSFEKMHTEINKLYNHV